MLIEQTQAELARKFLALHQSSETFVLPNAWDVASAAVFSRAGFHAIGTTSAGIAATYGYADGERIPFEHNLAVIKRIADYSELPISADVEGGYPDTVEDISRVAHAVIGAGAVGLNLEDTIVRDGAPLLDIVQQAERIGALRRTADEVGVHLVINARTDALLVGGINRNSLAQAIDRGNAYRAAGADCVFVPDNGDLDKASIVTLASEIAGPLNIIAGDSTPPLSELQEIGVSRVSLGPRPMRAVLTLLRKIASEIQTDGTYEIMSDSSISYAEMNGWFDRAK